MYRYEVFTSDKLSDRVCQMVSYMNNHGISSKQIIKIINEDSNNQLVLIYTDYY